MAELGKIFVNIIGKLKAVFGKKIKEERGYWAHFRCKNGHQRYCHSRFFLKLLKDNRIPCIFCDSWEIKISEAESEEYHKTDQPEYEVTTDFRAHYYYIDKENNG